MKIKKRLKIRDIAGEAVVLMQDKGVTDMAKVISLNPTSKMLWENLQGKDFDKKDIVELLTSHFEVEEAQAAVDADKWIESLTKCGVLE